MAFPQVGEITVTQFGVDATAHLVNMPAAVDAGDLLICLFSNDNSARYPATPAGWTLLWSGTTGSTSFSAFAKDADGTEDGTTVDFVTSSSEMAVAHVYRITAASWLGTLGTDVVVGTPATGTNVNPNPPSVTPGWTDDTLWIACFGGNNDNTVSAFPTNYTNTTSHNSGGGTGGCTLGSCRRELNAGSDDPGFFTFSESTGWVANTIAIRPAAVAGGGDARGAITTRRNRLLLKLGGTCG